MSSSCYDKPTLVLVKHMPVYCSELHHLTWHLHQKTK